MADLVFERCVPSERAPEIKGLFERVGQPEFSAVFDRAYKVREKQGLRSWIGIEDGRTVLHISVSPQPFSNGSRTLVCGLPGDLMADEGHRQFWGPLKLVRRVVADTRGEKTTDFLLTSYTSAAEGVFKAAGFKQFAALSRYVMPLIWPYPLLRRLLHRGAIPAVFAVPFGDPKAESLLRGLDSPGSFRPVATTEYFTSRMPRTDYPNGLWLFAGERAAPEAAVLVSRKSKRELILADALWRSAKTDLSSVLLAAARWGAGARHQQLTLVTTQDSRLALAARAAGFLVRPGQYVVLYLPLTSPDVIPPPQEWTLTPFALTSW